MLLDNGGAPRIFSSESSSFRLCCSLFQRVLITWNILTTVPEYDLFHIYLQGKSSQTARL